MKFSLGKILSIGLATLATWVVTADRVRGNPCIPAPSGLVGWWSAEGNASNQIAGSSGTLAGNTSYGPGEVGQGFVFDGDGDGVALGNPASLQVQNLTIETWIKRASTTVVSYGSGGNGTIFSYGTGAYYFGISTAGFLFFSQAGNSEYVTGPYITDINFHHVAVTKVGSTIAFFIWMAWHIRRQPMMSPSPFQVVRLPLGIGEKMGTAVFWEHWMS